MKVYITKYALSQGILIGEINIEANENESINFKPGHAYYLFHPGEWYKNLESAQRRAEQMKNEKLRMLCKKIERISNLDFTEEILSVFLT